MCVSLFYIDKPISKLNSIKLTQHFQLHSLKENFLVFPQGETYLGLLCLLLLLVADQMHEDHGQDLFLSAVCHVTRRKASVLYCSPAYQNQITVDNLNRVVCLSYEYGNVLLWACEVYGTAISAAR